MYDPKSILQMARGAFQERVDLEMAKVIDNILDPNTKPTQKRKVTMTMEFVPDDDRQNIAVSVTVKSDRAYRSPVFRILPSWCRMEIRASAQPRSMPLHSF